MSGEDTRKASLAPGFPDLPLAFVVTCATSSPWLVPPVAFDKDRSNPCAAVGRWYLARRCNRTHQVHGPELRATMAATASRRPLTRAAALSQDSFWRSLIRGHAESQRVPLPYGRRSSFRAAVVELPQEWHDLEPVVRRVRLHRCWRFPHPFGVCVSGADRLPQRRRRSSFVRSRTCRSEHQPLLLARRAAAAAPLPLPQV